MSDPTTTLPIAGGLYLLSISRRGELLQHTLSRQGEEPLLSSIPSQQLETPALVELHLQEGVCYLTGMSGDRYWSMTAREAPASPGQAVVEFDVACRAKSPLGPAGSVYAAEAVVDVRTEGAQVHRQSSELWIVHNPPTDANASTLRYCYEIQLPIF